MNWPRLRSHERARHEKVHSSHINSSKLSTEEEGHTHSTHNTSRLVGASNIAGHLGWSPSLRHKAQVSNTVIVKDPTHRKQKRNLESIDIETTFGGNIGGQGVMVDIRAKTKVAVRIRSLTFHALHATDYCNVKVYTKHGTHRSYEKNSTAWINVVDTLIECKGYGMDTVITPSMFDSSLRDELIIEANSSRAIYINSRNTLRYSPTSSVDAVFVEDSYVQILEGTGLSTDFGNPHSPRMWNGMLTYELMTSDSPPQPPGCVSSFATPSKDYLETYGHMFNIGSSYPGGIIMDGIEFQTHATTTLNYEIYTIASTYENFFIDNDWTLVASGSITGGGAGVGTRIAGTDFSSVTIETGTTQGLYITLDTQDLRYAESSGLMVGDTFAQNDHISLTVGIGVANYPMGEDFFTPRQWSGRILYRTALECPVPINLQYIYEVQYPKHSHGDPVLDKVNEIVNHFVVSFLKANSEVKSLEEKSGNSIGLLSTETVSNNVILSSCASTEDSDLCNVLVTTVKLGYCSPSDTGYIKKLLLQQNSAVSDAIRNSFITKYTGDKIIDTKQKLVLRGTKSPKIGSEEIIYLEEVIKSFLNKHVISSGVEILTVKVINRRILKEEDFPKILDEDNFQKVLGNESSSVTLQIIISGVHRPPPSIDFDSIVEDAINYKTEELIDDLASNSEDKGAKYFFDVKEIELAAPPGLISHSPSPPSQLGNTPSSTPTQTLSLHNNGGQIALGSSVVVAIIAALSTLGLVFGSYVAYKIVYNLRTVKRKCPTNTDKDQDNAIKSFAKINTAQHYIIDPATLPDIQMSLKSATDHDPSFDGKI